MLFFRSRRWLLVGGHTPFAYLLGLRAYGRRVQNFTTAKGLIEWAEDLRSLRFIGLKLDLDRSRGFLQIKFDLLQQELTHLLLVTSDTLTMKSY